MRGSLGGKCCTRRDASEVRPCSQRKGRCKILVSQKECVLGFPKDSRNIITQPNPVVEQDWTAAGSTTISGAMGTSMQNCVSFPFRVCTVDSC